MNPSTDTRSERERAEARVIERRVKRELRELRAAQAEAKRRRRAEGRAKNRRRA